MMNLKGSVEPELRDYVQILRRNVWFIAGVTALVLAASLVLTLRQEDQYSATAEVLLAVSGSPEALASSGGAGLATDIELMRSRSVRQAVEERLGRPPSVVIAAKGATNVVQITATNTLPTEAAREVNVFAETYIETRRLQAVENLVRTSEQFQARIAEIDEQLAALEQPIEELDAEIAVADPSTAAALRDRQSDLRAQSASERQTLQTERAGYTAQVAQLDLAGDLAETGGDQLVSAAEVPSVPFSPTPRRSALLALIVGLAAGVALVFTREYLDESIKDKGDVEAATGSLTVVGMIPLIAAWKDGDDPRLIARDDPSSPAAEAYRTLRTSVQFLGIDRPLELVQITSASGGEGKTTTLSNLAVTLASAGAEVIVACCDLRRPRVHEFFELGNDIGFTSVLLGDIPLAEALQRVPGLGVSLLASGPLPPNPAELLSSPSVKSVFQELRGMADIVLVDSPPILPVSDGLILSGLVDATLVVATAHRTSRKDLHRTVELLEQVQAPMVGAVLNGVDATNSYGYRYGYGYEAPATGRRARSERSSRARRRS